LKSRELYYNFQQIVNKNAINDNIGVDEQRFVMLFNRKAAEVLLDFYSRRNDDDLRIISKFMCQDKPLEKKTTKSDHISFKLPKDFFQHSNLKVYGSQDSCKNQRILSIEVKDPNIEFLYNDENTCPNFPHRETFYTFTECDVQVYIKDFNIDEVLMTYYKCPTKIDIAGYIDIEGNPSKDIDPCESYNEKFLLKVLQAAAKDFHIYTDEFNKASLASQNYINNF
jgi:hypothetical protein